MAKEKIRGETLGGVLERERVETAAAESNNQRRGDPESHVSVLVNKHESFSE